MKRARSFTPVLASHRSFGRASAGVVVVSVACFASPAAADDVAGSVTGQLVVADRDVGGAGTLDLGAAIGPLRLGGFFGAGITPAPATRDAHNRAYLTLGGSAALVLEPSGTGPGSVAFEMVARAGFWGGSTQATKLTAGGLLGGGAYVDVSLGEGVFVGAGAEAWMFFGAGETWAIVPGLRLRWGAPILPASDDTP